MTHYVVGVDPGLSGGIAVIETSGVLVAIADLPVVRDKKLAWIDGGALSSWLLEHTAGHPKRAVVERVSAMPGQGVSSSFVFGVGFGAVLAVLQCLQIPLELVTAAQWKRDLALGKDKKASLHRARLQWPTAELDLARHDGRAEALLIAYWRAKQGTV